MTYKVLNALWASTLSISIRQMASEIVIISRTWWTEHARLITTVELEMSSSSVIPHWRQLVLKGPVIFSRGDISATSPCNTVLMGKGLLENEAYVWKLEKGLSLGQCYPPVSSNHQMSDIFRWGRIVFQRLQGEPKPWYSVTVLAARPNTLLKHFILALTLICHPSVCPIIALLLAMICFSSGENTQQLVAYTVCTLFGAGQIADSGYIRAFVLKTAACICWKWLWEWWDWPSVVKNKTISSKMLKCYIKQRAGC